MLSRRLFSSSARSQAKATISKLANGVTVISKPSGAAKSSVGVYLNSGSRAENAYNSGVSALTGHLATSKNAAKSQGVNLYTSNAKEVSGLVSATYQKGNSAAAFAAIKSIVSNLESTLNDSVAISAQKEKAVAIAEAFENSPKDMVLEHMIGTAFQGTSLALPRFGKADTLETLESEDLKAFVKKNLVSSNVAIVQVGDDVDHNALIKLASELNIPTGSRAAFEPASFLGSDVRLRDDTLPQAHVALSVKTPGASDLHAYYTGLVASKINGTYVGAASPFSPLVGSPLGQFLAENHLVDSFEHFQLAFKDVGLWGAYLASSNIGNFDETVHFTLKNWNRFSEGTVKQFELEKAKAELKLALLKPVECPVQESAQVAEEYFLHEHIASEAEIAQNVDAVTDAQIAQWAQEHLWDQDVAFAGNGQIEALFDYNRVRNDMSANRW